MASHLINKEAFHLIDKDSHSDHGTITTKGLEKVMGSLGENPTKVDSPSDVWWQCDLTGSLSLASESTSPRASFDTIDDSGRSFDGAESDGLLDFLGRPVRDPPFLSGEGSVPDHGSIRRENAAPRGGDYYRSFGEPDGIFDFRPVRDPPFLSGEIELPDGAYAYIRPCRGDAATEPRMQLWFKDANGNIRGENDDSAPVKMVPISACDWSTVEGEITEAKSQDMTSEIGAHGNGSIDFPENLGVGKMGEGGGKTSDAEEKLTKFLYEERYGQERPSFYCDSRGVLRMPKLDAIKKEIKKDLGPSSESTKFFVYEERYGEERPSFCRDSDGVLRMPKLDAIKKDLVQTRRQRSMRRMRWAPSSLDGEPLLSTASFNAGYSFNQ